MVIITIVWVGFDFGRRITMRVGRARIAKVNGMDVTGGRTHMVGRGPGQMWAVCVATLGRWIAHEVSAMC